MARIDTVKLLLGIADTDTSAAALAAFALTSAEEIVLDYCHISEIPAGLDNTVARMAVDIFRTENFGSKDAPQRVTAVTRGDISTSFGVLAPEYTASLLKDYTKVLRSFRKVGFPS